MVRLCPHTTVAARWEDDQRGVRGPSGRPQTAQGYLRRSLTALCHCVIVAAELLPRAIDWEGCRRDACRRLPVRSWVLASEFGFGGRRCWNLALAGTGGGTRPDGFRGGDVMDAGAAGC